MLSLPELLWYADLCERQADHSVASLAWRQKVSADKPHQIDLAMQASCAKGIVAGSSTQAVMYCSDWSDQTGPTSWQSQPSPPCGSCTWC